MNIRTRERRSVEPEDARIGWVAPTPADAREAAADRDMADAERAVAAGTGSGDQTRRVARMGEARTQEDRRRVWLGED